MWLQDSTSSYVTHARLVQALWTVGAAPNDVAVVIVLAVVLPSALVADLVCASLGQRRVATTRAGVESVSSRGDHVLLGGVNREPLHPPTDELVIGDGRIVVRAAICRMF